MRKIYAITAVLVSLIMIGLLISVMAANRRSEAQLKELDSFIATYETAAAPETVTWVKVEAPTNDTTVVTTETTGPDTDTSVQETDEETAEEEMPAEDVSDILLTEREPETEYPGTVLNHYDGINYNAQGILETYYCLPMEGVVDWMHSLGYEGDYWVRYDGVKMFGEYVMVAADYDQFPKGTVVETSLGTGLVCDTGEGGYDWFDIATAWDE